MVMGRRIVVWYFYSCWINLILFIFWLLWWNKRFCFDKNGLFNNKRVMFWRVVVKRIDDFGRRYWCCVFVLWVVILLNSMILLILYCCVILRVFWYCFFSCKMWVDMWLFWMRIVVKSNYVMIEVVRLSVG